MISRLSGVPLPRLLAAIFSLYGMMAVLFLSIEMPPFQNFDEESHFLRAEQVSRLELTGHRFGTSLSGGYVDPGPTEVVAAFPPLREFVLPEATPAMFEQAAKVQWGDPQVRLSFSNTAIYAPFLYLPAVTGIWLGKGLHLGVMHTLWISRMLSGFACVAVGVAAIMLADNAAPLLFTLLLLPMSLIQMTAVSQDGAIIALSALAAAIFVHGLKTRHRPFRFAYAVLCISLALLAVAKQPYLMLAVFAVLPTWESRRIRAIGLVFIVAAVLAWTITAASTAMIKGHPAESQMNFVVAQTTSLPGSDPSQQVGYLWHHPAGVVPVAKDALRHVPHLISSFIGEVRWGSVLFPKAYKTVAYPTLLMAVLASCRFRDDRPELNGRSLSIMLLGLAATIVAIQAALYISFCPVGSRELLGVQGRYFLPVAMLGAAVPSYFALSQRLDRLRPRLLEALIVFPAISLPVLFVTVLRRFYI